MEKIIGGKYKTGGGYNLIPLKAGKCEECGTDGIEYQAFLKFKDEDEYQSGANRTLCAKCLEVWG